MSSKVLSPNDFADLADVPEALGAFERRYEQTATPFKWRFTRENLALLLKKLADKPDYPQRPTAGYVIDITVQST